MKKQFDDEKQKLIKENEGKLKEKEKEIT